MTTTATNTDRQVWIGCLACYNDGRLLGAWHPADEAAAVTTDALHAVNDAKRHDLKDQREGYGEHEELWCLDIEGFGHWNREMSPCEATRKDAAITAACEQTGAPAAAVLAWAAYTGNDDLDGFEDDWHGEHDSFVDFVQELHDEIYTEKDLGPLAAYIDWAKVARDWEFSGGWHAADSGEGTVYVFSCS